MNLLSSELGRFTELRRRLIEADPQIDETTLLDTLEGATNLHEAIGEVVRSALDDEAMVGALKSRLGDLKVRLERISRRGEAKRQVALAAMEEAGIDKVLEPDFTVSMRVASPSVVITCEEHIPAGFWVLQDPKLDKRGILDAMKAGNRVAGAELSNSRVTLAVRTK